MTEPSLEGFLSLQEYRECGRSSEILRNEFYLWGYSKEHCRYVRKQRTSQELEHDTVVVCAAISPAAMREVVVNRALTLMADILKIYDLPQQRTNICPLYLYRNR